MEIFGLVLIFAAFYATRYLLKSNTTSKITPIYYVIGILLAPLTLLIALLKWLFRGRA